MSKSINLKHFISKDQLRILYTNARKSEEKEYFQALIQKIQQTIKDMPETFQTAYMKDNAPVSLHYFNASSDWYIIEKDIGSENDEEPGLQIEAFGYAILNKDYKMAELGYISIQELIENGVELDLYYEPEKLGDLKKRIIQSRSA